MNQKFRIAIVMLMFVLVLNGCQETSKGETYNNEEYGFSFEIPKNWAGKYEVVEEDNKVTFYYTGYEYEGGAFQEFFKIIVMDEESYNEKERGRELLLAIEDGNAFFVVTPLDVGIADEEKSEEYSDLYINRESIKELFSMNYSKNQLGSEESVSEQELMKVNLSDSWNELWDDIVEDGINTTLSSDQIAQVNEVIAPTFTDTNDNLTVNPISCFFTSYYSSPEDMDFANFLRYFPYHSDVNDIEEFNCLKSQGNWPFGEELETTPVPIHRYLTEDIELVMWEYAGIKLEDLKDVGLDEILYLEDYDAYYNFTSDFGPGFFNCTSGEVADGTIKLYEEHGTYKVAILTLEKQNGRYVIVSHQEVDEQENDAINEVENEFDLIIKPTDSKLAEINYVDSQYILDGQTVGYVDKFARLSLDRLAGYFDFENEGNVYSKGTYAFEVHEGERVVTTYYNGQQVDDWNLSYDTIFESGDIYVVDFDIAEVLGLEKTWNPEDNSILFSGTDYSVRDFGTIDIFGYDLFLNSERPSDVDVYIYPDSGNMVMMSGHYDNELGSFVGTSQAKIDSEVTDVRIIVRNKGRILYFSVMKDVMADITKHKISTGQIGKFTYLELELPKAGYVISDDGNIYINGTISASREITVIISKDGTEVDRGQFPIVDGEFDIQMPLKGDEGVYNVEIMGEMNPYGIQELFHFYVLKQ
ncbi:hypothetical protein SAMN02745751_02690 [Dethiosulfatibacter aminovorans DSM 17477]|uniref:Copper amine oxidase N-terminal domain-containing protein n=1 Tax=Dethiosulfatibacter aminovorans DSM 17477 TaxID=1121476 RepID=A0A1M6JQ76_9FIRM|nr:hypothetical protein [Dethiosulfatibacter aminovorans]SHJ48814.1 hypothetical protein SAMN02745751_02690 [Dethiosulfatibacter aminovorans DSM 17477]